MRIAIIGSGQAGSTLAAGWARAGHDVVLGSRNPGGPAIGGVPVDSIAGAAAGADVVVNATPGMESVALFSAQPDGWLDGVVLLDVGNADDGAGNLAYPDGSLAEALQAAFPAARVVKSLNTLESTVMVNPALLPEPTTVFVSADDLAAKAVVTGLLRDLGWDDPQVLDLGPLRTARATEHLIPLYYALRDALGTPDFNYRVVQAE
ncbi:NADPH-dependent F420 reductase [Microbacteriaceae bacterium 4G12]